MQRDFCVVHCSNVEMLKLAQRLRYEVYCEELKRSSPYVSFAVPKLSTFCLGRTQ
jgi:hypothetical protein